MGYLKEKLVNNSEIYHRAHRDHRENIFNYILLSVDSAANFRFLKFGKSRAGENSTNKKRGRPAASPFICYLLLNQSG
jgi:hypothetical protein